MNYNRNYENESNDLFDNYIKFKINKDDYTINNKEYVDYNNHTINNLQDDKMIYDQDHDDYINLLNKYNIIKYI